MTKCWNVRPDPEICGVGGDPMTSTVIFYGMKALWNGMRLKNPFDFGDESYTNVPSASASFVMEGRSLSELFAPAIAKCKKCSQGK